MGKSQTIVSISVICGGSHCVSLFQSMALTAVTNSKWSRHFNTTKSVSNEGVTYNGTGSDKCVWRNPTLNSWCLLCDTIAVSSMAGVALPTRRRFSSGTISWLCRVTEYWMKIQLYILKSIRAALFNIMNHQKDYLWESMTINKNQNNNFKLK